MCFIEWCNENQGFLSFALSLISIVIAIRIPVYLARNQKRVDLFQIKFDFYTEIKSQFNPEMKDISEIADWYTNQNLWTKKRDALITKAKLLFGANVGEQVASILEKCHSAGNAAFQISIEKSSGQETTDDTAALDEYKELCKSLAETLAENIRIER